MEPNLVFFFHFFRFKSRIWPPWARHRRRSRRYLSLFLCLSLFMFFEKKIENVLFKHTIATNELQGTRLLGASGFTRLCKGLSVVLIALHIVVHLFPSAVTYLALIPARYLSIYLLTLYNNAVHVKDKFRLCLVFHQSCSKLSSMTCLVTLKSTFAH